VPRGRRLARAPGVSTGHFSFNSRSGRDAALPLTVKVCQERKPAALVFRLRRLRVFADGKGAGPILACKQDSRGFRRHAASPDTRARVSAQLFRAQRG
jgi:hypothetical protein